MSWRKRLQELEPITSTTRLHEQIYTKIIKEAQNWTKDTDADYEDNKKLFAEILIAHKEFKEDPRHDEWDDMFGEYLVETEQLYDRAGQFFTPMHIVRAMCEMTVGVMTDEQLLGEPQMMSDPAAGCGRFMIGAAEIYAKRVGCFNFLFVNQDIDFRMYVYKTMNAILYGIPSLNIHCDSIALNYWEGTMVWQPLGCPTMWHTVPKERLEEIMPRFEAPKVGLEKFIEDVPAKQPTRRIRRSKKDEPKQSTLG